MDAVTLSPIRSHLSLKPGVNDQADRYRAFLQSLAALDERIDVPGLRDQTTGYESLEQDVVDARLFVWRRRGQAPAQGALPEGLAYELIAHVHSNTVSVIELRLRDLPALAAGELEQDIQALTKTLVRQAYPELYAIFRRLAERVRPALLVPAQMLAGIAPYDAEQGPEVLWVARSVLLSRAELAAEHRQTLVTQWLAETQRPADARDLILASRDYSMTWLNYVLVERQPGELGYLIDAMRLAQYFYAAQEVCNNRLRNAISRAYLKENLKQAESQLSQSRVAARLLLIHYQELRKHLTRRKRQAVDEIMAVWDFDILVENGGRMVEVCSARLEENHHRRRERSSFFTDLILVAIGFFAVVDLALTISQYSREVMSRPALDYTDPEVSWVLALVAAIDTDDVLVGSVLLVVVLLGVYLYAKRH